MRRFFSRYHPRYVRSLVYMLQASEYNVADYLAWDRRVNNFAHVEKRKNVQWTLKATLLFASGWMLVALWLYVEYRAYIAVQAGSDVPLVVGFFLIFLFPLLLPLLMLVPLAIIQAAQWPVEQWMIAQAKKKLLQQKAFKIAIAGSYGKTSMREILRTVLSEDKKVAAPGGSENTPIGIARFVSRLKGDEEILIFELGEYYLGDIKKLCDTVLPDLGIITGVNEAHLSKFKTVEAARQTIYELRDYLGNKPVYMNFESVLNAVYSDGDKDILYSASGVTEHNTFWKTAGVETSLEGTSFALAYGSDRIDVQSKLLGTHQVGPLSAAAHIATRLGLTKQQIEKGLAKTKPFAHRLERRDDPSGVITLDDSYNGNPDGVRAVIEFLTGIENHRRWYVTPGLVEMGERSEAIHKNIGQQLAKANIEKVALIRNSVTPWIEQGLKESGYKGEIIWFDDALKCYAALPSMTVTGDLVVLQNDWPDQYA